MNNPKPFNRHTRPRGAKHVVRPFRVAPAGSGAEATRYSGSSAPKGANDAKGADMLAGASQTISVSNRRSPFLLLHKLSIQKQHLEKQKARAERRSGAVLRKAALIEAQMARLGSTLGLSGCEASNPSPAQFQVASLKSQELETRNPKPETHLKEVRYRY